MVVDGLLDDREPEPGAGQGASRGGAVEAVEDVRQIGVVDAGPVVAHCQHPVGEADVDGAAGRAPLDRVVEDVVDRALQPRAGPDDPVGLQPALEAQPRRRPVLRPRDRRRHELVERERLACVDRPSRRGRPG